MDVNTGRLRSYFSDFQSSGVLGCFFSAAAVAEGSGSSPLFVIAEEELGAPLLLAGIRAEYSPAASSGGGSNQIPGFPVMTEAAVLLWGSQPRTNLSSPPSSV